MYFRIVQPDLGLLLLRPGRRQLLARGFQHCMARYDLLRIGLGKAIAASAASTCLSSDSVWALAA